MKLIISPDSWHYHFAQRGGFKRYSPMELCFYTRRVLAGLLLTCLAGAAAGFVAYCLMDLGLSLWFGVDCGWPGILVIASGLFALLIAGVFAVLAIVFLLFDSTSPLREYQIGKRITPKAVTSTAGLVVAQYRGWKEKYCPTIEIESHP